MRLAFRSVAVFNVATALWLSVMFLILRHPGFEQRAALAMSIALFCGFAVYAARRHNIHADRRGGMKGLGGGGG